MATLIDLHVRNVDIFDDDVQSRLAQIGNVSFGSRGGLINMTVFVDGEDVVGTVLETAQQLSHVLPGATALRVDPDLVSVSDIAARVGASREAVRQWVKGGRIPFPIEFSSFDSGQKAWRWLEVAEWLYRVKNIDMDEELPTQEDAVQIDTHLAQLHKRTGNQWKIIHNTGREILIPAQRDSSLKSSLRFTSSITPPRRSNREESSFVG